MKIGLGKIALLVFVCYAITSQTAVFAGGIKDNGSESGVVTGGSAPSVVSGQTETRQEMKTLLWSEPSERPEWVDTVPQNDTEFYFIGTSQPYDTPANARDSARESARIQVLEYYGQVIESQAISLSSVSGTTRETLAPYVVREDEIKTFAQNVVSEVGTVAYYTEMYLTNDNKEKYIVYTLHQINRQKAEEEISGFAQKISERYTAAFSQWNTLRTALEGYAFVVKSLERNPLHRIMAYYDTSTGRAGLYEYARVKINELANSVSIETIPARTIQETETLTTRINLRSSIMQTTGLLDCQASIFGISTSDNIIFPFKSANDDPFNLQIRNIQSGSYNVMVEILLSELTGGVAKNINTNFSFSVTQLNALLDTPEAIEAGIKRAVDTLAARLQPGTETVIGSFTMTGTDIPSELSIFLTEKVTHYAKNNQERKYRIVADGTEQTAVLSGFFTKRNNRVDVTLELSTPNRERDGSQIFQIAVDLLENTMKIAIEPEKIPSAIDEFNRLAQTETIHIKASLNSPTRTYMHGDNLVLTVTADTNCFFKIFHLNVDNQLRMIYPTRNDTNNALRANESRTVFGNSRYIFFEPYGAEKIIVVASSVQFPNIEQEYSQPWKPATEEAITAAIVGSGQAEYRITVIKPHEVYEYAKPENMAELYQSICNDVDSQNGYREGNANSVFYIIDNIRGSYRVTGDTIQFATYYLDTYTAAAYRGMRTRGSGFTFSFAKPQNISQAVQTVRSSILEKDGTFNGDEQQGNFSASGIAGRYEVANEVMVTISEKPMVVPKTLIESEVKKFFGVR